MAAPNARHIVYFLSESARSAASSEVGRLHLCLNHLGALNELAGPTVLELTDFCPYFNFIERRDPHRPAPRPRNTDPGGIRAAFLGSRIILYILNDE